MTQRNDISILLAEISVAQVLTQVPQNEQSAGTIAGTSQVYGNRRSWLCAAGAGGAVRHPRPGGVSDTGRTKWGWWWLPTPQRCPSAPPSFAGAGAVAACGLAKIDLEGMVEAVDVLALELAGGLAKITKLAVPLLGHERVCVCFSQ